MKKIIATLITIITGAYITYSAITYFESQEERLTCLENEVKLLHVSPMFLSEDGTCWYVRGEKVKKGG